MNVCEFSHESQYQISYKPAKGRNSNPTWLVCESCFKTKEYFGSEDEIVSIKILA